MPISGGKYVAPVWVDNAPPALDAAELQAISDSVASYADPVETVPNIIRPNLLDNWYFVGGGSQQGGGQFPINSLGLTSYSNVSGYSIDRWAIQTTRSLTLDSAGLTVTPTATNNGRVVVQGLPGIPLLGKTVTVSLLCTSSGINNVYVSIFGNGNYMAAYDTYIPATQNARIAGVDDVYLISATVTMPNEFINSGRDKLTFGFGFTNTGTIVPSFTAIAAKLEYGSTQTLVRQENGVWVLNEIPNFDEQFMRCATLPGVPSRVESGSYVGTGTYGSGNPNSLTFGFVPKTVIVKTEATAAYFLYALAGSQSARSGVSSSAATLTWSGNTLQWYSSSAISQMNTSGTTYYYVAIG